MSGNEGTGQNGQGGGQGPNEGQSSGGPEGLYAGRGHDELTSLIGDMGGNPKQGHQSGQQQQGGGQQQQQQQAPQQQPQVHPTGAGPSNVPSKKADDGQQQQQGGQQQTQQQGGNQQQTQQSATSAIDPSVLEQIVQAAARGATAAQQGNQQQQQQQKDLSPEEFNARYGLVTVTEAHMARLMDQDPKKAAAELNNILQSNLRAAVLMARDLTQTEFAKVRGEYEPHVSSWKAFQAEQREAQMQERFYKAHPDLVNEKELVKEMTDAIRARVLSGQIAFKTEAEVFQAVGEASRKLLARMNKQANGSGSGGQQSNQSQHQQQQGQGQSSSSRQMTAASAAGQSGGGQTAGSSEEQKIFGENWK